MSNATEIAAAVRYEIEATSDTSEILTIESVTWLQVVALSEALTSFKLIGKDSPTPIPNVCYVNTNRTPKGVVSHMIWENNPICGRTGPVRDGCSCATVHTSWWGYFEGDLEATTFTSRRTAAQIIIRKGLDGYYLAEFRPGHEDSHYWEIFSSIVN